LAANRKAIQLSAVAVQGRFFTGPVDLAKPLREETQRRYHIDGHGLVRRHFSIYAEK